MLSLLSAVQRMRCWKIFARVWLKSLSIIHNSEIKSILYMSKKINSNMPKSRHEFCKPDVVKTLEEKDKFVAKMKFFGSHKFSTKGIWIHKGRKKVFLDEQQNSEFLLNNSIKDAKIEVFTSKRKDGGMFVSISFGNEISDVSSMLKIERDNSKNIFNVCLNGQFCKELSDIESKMLFYNDQKIEDINFSIRGIVFGDIMNGGGISRTDMWDAEEESDVFPAIDFEYIP